jgi:hypothetical protein
MNHLLDHPIIKRLHRESRVTLTDLLDRKLFIEPPAEPCGHIHPSAWFLCYQEDLAQAESERLRAARKRNPRLILAAALVVAGATGKLSKAQKYMAFDFTRYVEDHEYELDQLVRRSTGSHNSAEIRKEEAAERMETAFSLWLKLDKPERDKCAIIATRMGCEADTVRGWRRKGWRSG